jgi:serine/threonine-protein kinase
MSESDARLGNTVAGRYVIRDVIGGGGQSTVYSAYEKATGREFAIKVLRPTLKDPHSVERLKREHEAMQSLAGTAAIEVYDCCETDDGAACIVMERLHGVDFDEYLARAEAASQRIMPAQLVKLFGPVVETVHAAHLRGIVHRDLKPGNLFVVDASRGNGVKVLDFGFAKFRDKRSVTAEGSIAGSPSYLAPEGWRGERNLTPAFDVYSFSAVVFRALAGEPPFDAKDLVNLLQLVTRGPRPSLHALRPDLPEALDGWVELALAADPACRFQNMPATWHAFRSFAGC